MEQSDHWVDFATMVQLQVKYVIARAYSYKLLKEKRACTCSLRHLANFISRLNIVQILNTHSAVQTAAVTIISYKPLSDLSFARYTG
jgi:hypothetical protein